MQDFSLVVSIVSLVVAAGAAYFTYSLNRHQLRLTSRNEFQKLLLEVNKELVRDSELWGIYDSGEEPHPMAALIRRDDPRQMAKLEGFGYMFMNVIQVVFAYFDEKGPTGRTEETIWNAWRGTAADLVNSSSIVRCILNKKDADQVFDARFLKWIRDLMRNGHDVGCGTGKA